MSYNSSFVSIGAEVTLTSFPKDIEVFGIVGFDLSDDTDQHQHLITYMQKAKNLSMVCRE